jgi:hypothetical protein
MTVRSLVAVVLLVGARPAGADRPHDWFIRAMPGLGYASDSATDCGIDGRVFAGGFWGGYEVAERVFVGAATTIMFNTLPAAGACVDTRLGLTAIVGPSFEYYLTDRWHVFAVSGYAEVDDGRDVTHRGMGTTVGVGWRFMTAELTTLRTWSEPMEHRITAFSLHAAFSFGVPTPR